MLSLVDAMLDSDLIALINDLPVFGLRIS